MEKSQKKKIKKVVVAFSGGIDSSIVSLILKKKGFEVTAVFMRLTNATLMEKRAKSLAKEINIPFVVFDFRNDFKKIIIDYFIGEYKKGKTPNPCVLCNKEIKFGLFLKEALKMKPDFVSTGHYVRILKKDNLFHLYSPKDIKKDQSYFLWKLNQSQLKKIIFPLGDYEKEEIKEIAKKNKLSSFDFKESQETCFAKEANDIFLRKNIKNKKGDIVNKKGEILGVHDGIFFYTIGQRKGIGLSGGPYWVIDKNIKNNELIVSKKEKDLFKKEVIFKKSNWIIGLPNFPIRVKAKIRYGHKPAYGILDKNKIIFDKVQKSITKGQSIVFYKGKEMIGGGIIS
jgi:tRNA-specific 2-thiouridylase